MRKALIDALKLRFQSYNDLVSATNDVELGKKLDIPKHKSLGEHLWCVVGARESYARALTVGKWEGFNCSLSEFSQPTFLEKIRSSADDVIGAIEGVEEWTKDRDELLLALSEHEVMHEGQIIRHMYGLESEMPDSIKWA
jgi:hypothetical protein